MAILQGWTIPHGQTSTAVYDPDVKMKVDLEREKFWNELKLYREMMDMQTKQQGGLANLIDAYNKSFAEAKAANENKYNQALGLVDQTSGQQAADIRTQYGQQRSAALQNLARTGMSNTTVGSTLTQGLGREQASSLNRLADQMLGTKLGVMQNFEYKYPEPGITEAAITALAPKYTFPTF